MFPLDGGRLIRLNKDGTNGEIIQSKKPKITFGTSIVHDHHIKDVDPTNEVTCEISTDDYGRVYIHNKSANEILLNGKAVTTTRPLLSNSIIKICDGVEFRWTYKSAKENISTENNDADFASWSDPAKKHMKQSRLQKQRPKGRLTEHAIHAYSSAIEDIAEKHELSAISDDEPDTGCSAFPIETVTQSNNLPNVPDVNESAALIDFSMAETQSDNETSPIVNDAKDKPNECSSKPDIIVKAQPSDCSVITVSSEESEVMAVHDISNNKTHELKDDERFIACPPSELPDDLFENDPSNIEKKPDVISDETMDQSESSVQIVHTTNTDMSIDESSAIADDADDSIIPETQDVLSQDSIASSSQNQSDIERGSELEQSQSNLSVVSINSHEDTVVKAVNDKTNVDESQRNIDEKLQASTASEHFNTDGARDDQSNAEFNESEKLFSQVDDFEDCTVSTKDQQFDTVESTQMISADEQPDTCEPNETATDAQQNSIAEAEAEAYNDGSIPTATSSCISIADYNNATPKLNDTTQELNLEAFNSDFEEMERLEFTSSDSPASSDSGHITANTSIAITAENVSANQTANTCQTTNSLTDKHLLGDVNSSSEFAITSTAFETDATPGMNAEANSSKDEQSMAAENEPENHPEPSSTSQDTFVRASENSDTNCAFELSHANSSLFKVQTDISNASSVQAEENVVSTSNEVGVVAEPSSDYVESAQSIHSMATCSTPARAIGKFDTCHSFVGSMQENARAMPNVQCVSTQLDISTAADSLSKCDDSTTEIEHMEQESATQNDENQMAAQTIATDTVVATTANDTTIESNSFASKELDISYAENTSTILELGQTLGDIESTQGEDEIMATKQNSHEIVSTTDDSQSDENSDAVDSNHMSVSQSNDCTNMETIYPVQLPSACDSKSSSESLDDCLENKSQSSTSQDESDAVQQATDGIEEAQGESEKVAEQNENIESRIDMDDEIPATQIVGYNSVSSTPVCDSKLPFEATSVRSSRRKQPQVEIGTPIGRRTPRNVNAGIASDTPSKLVITATQLKETEDSTIDIEKTSEMPTMEQAQVTVHDDFVTPQKSNAIVASDTPSSLEIPTSQLEKSQESAIDGNGPIYSDEKALHKSDETAQITSQGQIDSVQQSIEENIEEAESGSETVVEQIENENKIDDEVPATQIECTDSVLSTPVCDLKLSSESTSVRSSRRKQPQLGTPIGGQTPRKVNAGIASDTPSKLVITATQQKETDSIDIEKTSEVPTVEQAQVTVQDVFVTPAKIDVIAKCSSTATRSTRRNRNIFENESNTPKQTHTEMTLVLAPDTPQQKESNEPQSIAEQNEKIESHNDADDEIPATQIEIQDSVLSTPVSDSKISSEASSVRSTRRKQLHLGFETPTGQRTPRKINVDIVSDIPSKSETQTSPLKVSEEGAIDGDELTHSEEKSQAIESEIEPDVEQNENIDTHTDTDDGISTAKTETTDAVLSTPVCDPKLPCESRSVRSSRRKQPHLEVGTPIGRRTPRKANVFNTPSQPEIPSTQFKESEEGTIDDEVTFEKLTVSSSPHKELNEGNIVSQVSSEDDSSTPAKIALDAECETAITLSVCRSETVLETQTGDSGCTPKEMNVSWLKDTPQTQEIESHNTTNEKISDTQIESNNSFVSSESATVIDDHVADPECIDSEEKGQITPEIIAPNSVPQGVSIEDENIEEVRGQNEEVIEQNENVESHTDKHDEIHANQIESQDSITSTPVCDLKIPSEASSVRSSRRKQPHLDIGTPIGRRTPRKIDISVAVETPSKQRMPALQLKESEEIAIDGDEPVHLQAKSQHMPDETVEKSPQENTDKIQEAIDEHVKAVESENKTVDEVKSDVNEEDDEAISMQIETQDSIMSTPVCDSKIPSEASSVRSSRRKQPQLEIGTQIGRQTPRKMNAGIASDTPSKPEMSHSQIEISEENTIDIEKTSEVLTVEQIQVTVQDVFVTPAKIDVIAKCSSTATRSTRRNRNIFENESNTPKQTHAEMTLVLATNTPQENESNESQSIAEQNEKIESHNDADDEIPATQIEIQDSVLSTPVSDLKIPTEASSVRSTRRKQPQIELGTPIGQRTPRNVNAGIASDTPSKLVITATQQKETEDNTIDIENTSVMPTTVQDVFVTPQKSDAIVASDTPSELEMSTSQLGKSQESAIDDNGPKYSDEKSLHKSDETAQITSQGQVDSVQQSIGKNIEEVGSESETVVEQNENTEAHIGTNDEIPTTQTESVDSVMSTPMCDNQPTECFDENVKAVENESETAVEVEQGENKIDGEVSDMQIEIQDPVLSTPVCDLKLSSESTSVRSSRRKQPQLGTPIGRQTPRKVNAGIASDTPSKLVITATQQKETEDSIDIEKTSKVPTVEQAQVAVQDVFVTPAKIDVIAKCSSTATRSTRRNRNIFENESNTPKQTHTEMTMVLAPNTPQQKESNEPQSIAEQNEKIESHNEADDEIPATQIEIQDSVLSTPVPDLKISSEASSVRSSRRKQPHLDLGTPIGRRTPRKMAAGVTLDTPCKLEESAIDRNELAQQTSEEVAENSPQHTTKNIQEGIDENAKAVESEIEKVVQQNESTETHTGTNDEIPTAQTESTDSVLSTPVCDSKLSCESTSVRSSRRKQPHLELGTPIGRRTPRKVNAVNTPSKPEMPSSRHKESNETVSDGKNKDLQQKAPENLSSNRDLGIVRSSKRKQTESDIEMPVAKRTPAETSTECEPNTSSIPHEVHNESPTVDKNHDGKISEVVDINQTDSQSQIESSEATVESIDIHSVDRIEANVSEDISGTDATEIQANDKSNAPVQVAEVSSAPEKKELLQASSTHPNVKVIIPRIGTPEIRKLTEGYIKVATGSSESNDTHAVDGKMADSGDSRSSKSSAFASRRRHPIREVEATTSQNATKTPSSEHRDSTESTESSSPKQNTEANRSGNKRVGTPLPANRKKGFHKNEKTVETNKDRNTEPIENSESTASGSKVESSNDDVTTKSGRSLRQKKMENNETKTEKKSGKKSAESQPAKRKPNFTTAAVEIDEPTEKDDVQKSTAPVVKASRRKRANTLTEKLTNDNNTITPIPMKSHLDHIATETKETPGSSRSLRARAIAVTIEETTSVTPKRSRKQRKASASDDKPAKKTDVVDDASNEVQQEQPQTIEKPKRQARRKANAAAAKKEETSENAPEVLDEKKPNKRTTKRTRTQSTELQKANEKQPSSTNTNDTEQVDEPEKKPKRATKPTGKGKPTGIQTDTEQQGESAALEKNAPSTSGMDAKLTIEKTSEKAEKKPKRGKGKKVEPENVDTVAAVAVPEVPTKKRTLRDRSASVCSDNVNKMLTSGQNTEAEPSTSEVPQKKRRLRDRTASTYVEKPTTTTESSKSKSKRNAVPAKPVQETPKADVQPEKKAKDSTKRPANNDTDAVAQSSPKKRNVRARTVSKSEENLSSMTETAKPKAKRGRKAEAESDVMPEVEEPQLPPPKRSRNTKKTTTKDTEVDTKSNAKESTADEKAKRSKKVTEPSDASEDNTPPIATRTRRRK